jgi:hypothetical protein
VPRIRDHLLAGVCPTIGGLRNSREQSVDGLRDARGLGAADARLAECIGAAGDTGVETVDVLPDVAHRPHGSGGLAAAADWSVMTPPPCADAAFMRSDQAAEHGRQRHAQLQ